MNEWSTKFPTQPGYYWFKWTSDDKPKVVEVEMVGAGPDPVLVVWIFGAEASQSVYSFDGFWKVCEL